MEINPAPASVRDGVGDVDGRELNTEPEGVLAHQIRDIVLIIEIMVGPVLGTVMPTAQLLKTRHIDIRQPTKLRHARVDGEASAIGLYGAIVGQKVEPNAVVAKPGIVHQAGTGSPNPVSADRVRANQICVLEDFVHEGMVHPVAGVVADHNHAIE